MAEIMSGQRILYSIDVFKTVKIKEGETEREIQRMYQLSIPYGVPFEEVYEVLETMTNDIKKLEQDNKERAQKQAEEAQKQAENTDKVN